MALAVKNRAGERRPDQTMSALCAADQQLYYYHYQKLLEIQKEIVREVVQGDKHNLRKSENVTHKSVSFTLHIVLICALQFSDFLRLCLSP